MLGWLVAAALALCCGRVHAQDAHIVNGNDWLQLDHSHKVMFVSGISQLLEMERHLVSGNYTRDSASFIPQLVEGLQGMTIGAIISRIDSYYSNNANTLDDSVIDAIFRAIIYPKAEGRFPALPLGQGPSSATAQTSASTEPNQ